MVQIDIHQQITNQIIEVLDLVTIEDFEAPFSNLAAQGMPFNPITENYYSGINILSLWVQQQKRSFSSNQWGTFKQWKEKGAQVQKGQKGSRIIFYKTLIQEDELENGEKETHTIPMLRSYTVFNSNQVDGYEGTCSNNIPVKSHVERLRLVDEFIKNTNADIRHNENRAYYNLTEDFINMPPKSEFLETNNSSATENYYSVLFHELTHWTGSESRLNRDIVKTKKKQQKSYAFEELIAELGSAFLCASLGVNQSSREDHAIYIKHWLTALNEDKKFIFQAAAQADKAVQFMNTLQHN